MALTGEAAPAVERSADIIPDGDVEIERRMSVLCILACMLCVHTAVEREVHLITYNDVLFLILYAN